VSASSLRSPKRLPRLSQDVEARNAHVLELPFVELGELVPLIIRDSAEIEGSMSALEKGAGGGLIVLPGAFTDVNREQIIALAARYRVPTIYGYRYFTASGGLISYGANNADMNRRAAAYVDRILKGERPADLPVQRPTAFELVINAKTTKALGLQVPDRLLALADEVIE
jgi:putative tryptophan/tyrosine transport system substrate-binding protein